MCQDLFPLAAIQAELFMIDWLSSPPLSFVQHHGTPPSFNPKPPKPQTLTPQDTANYFDEVLYGVMYRLLAANSHSRSDAWKIPDDKLIELGIVANLS